MTLKKIAYLFGLIAAMTTLGIGFSAMEELSLAGLSMLILAIVPYVIMSFVISKSKHALSVSMNGWLTIFLTFIGTVTLVYEMYFHKDAQSALAFVVIPLYQLFVFAIISFVVYLVAKRY